MISSKCVNGIIVMIFQEFKIYRLNTFAATHASSWVSRKMEIQVSHCLTDYFCWNIAWEFVTIWISRQVSPGSYVSNNTSNNLWITWWICVWILLPQERDILINHHRCASPVTHTSTHWELVTRMITNRCLFVRGFVMARLISMTFGTD